MYWRLRVLATATKFWRLSVLATMTKFRRISVLPTATKFGRLSVLATATKFRRLTVLHPKQKVPQIHIIYLANKISFCTHKSTLAVHKASYQICAPVPVHAHKFELYPLVHTNSRFRTGTNTTVIILCCKKCNFTLSLNGS